MSWPCNTILRITFVCYSGSKMSNTDNMIDEILSEQLRLSNLRIKFSDTYRMLDILRYVSWKGEM